MTAAYSYKEGSIKTTHRKDKHFTKQYTGLIIDPERIHEAINLRIYETDGAAYACLWVNYSPAAIHTAGSGRATGYGYHNRSSAAAQMAINDAGFALSEPIDGRGDEAIKAAVEAILERISPGSRFHVVTAHP